MKFTASLAADLHSLTAALDDPEADVAASVRRMAADTAAAIPSFLGLSVVVSQHDPAFTFTVLDDGITADDIHTSIRLAPQVAGDIRDVPSVAFILYAGSPGTFVDLAADLGWLTGRPPTDFALDAHIAVSSDPYAAAPLAASVVNQAVGVLIGRGHTPEQAHRELDSQAAVAGTDRPAAAHLILATLPPAAAEGAGRDADKN